MWRPCSELGAHYRVEQRDVYEGIEERGLDRILLDLPEPWRVVPHAEEALRPGGILLVYLPSHQPDSPAPVRTRPQPVRNGLDPRGPAPDLAHRGPVGAARPPDGGPHRLFDLGPPAVPGRGADRAADQRRLMHRVPAAAGVQLCSMKMHSPGHSSDASTTASSSSAGTAAIPAGAARLVLDVGTFLHVGQPVVEQGEHRGRDLLAETVAGAEILVDPDLHQLRHS